MNAGPQRAHKPTEEFAHRLSAAKNGCPEALGQLLQGCHRYLLMVAEQALESTLRPKQGASDLVQNTYCLAHRGFSTFRGTTPDELSAWLHRILERQLQNHNRAFRRTQRRQISRQVSVEEAAAQLIQQIASPPATDKVEQREELERVEQAIASLPESYREVIQLHTFDRLTFPQIAVQMNRTEGAVQKLWSRAIEKLQSKLREQT